MIFHWICNNTLIDAGDTMYGLPQNTSQTDSLQRDLLQAADQSVVCVAADPKGRTKGYGDSFIPRAVSLWTTLPVTCFPLSSDLPSFQRNIKSYFLHLWGYIAFHLTPAIPCVLHVFLLFFSVFFILALSLSLSNLPLAPYLDWLYAPFWGICLSVGWDNANK